MVNEAERALVTVDQMYQTPNDIVAMASDKAKALQGVVMQRKNPLMIQGKQYLQFEDWQTLGRFDGVTAGVDWTKELDGDTEGYLAHASCYQGGVIISSADGQCDRSEPKWANKPSFQLRSMAQTRACAKCLRNVLAWVAVLAGYEPTPAEEMVDDTHEAPPKKKTSAPLNITTILADVRRLMASLEEDEYSEKFTDFLKDKYHTGVLDELSLNEANALHGALSQKFADKVKE